MNSHKRICQKTIRSAAATLGIAVSLCVSLCHSPSVWAQTPTAAPRERAGTTSPFYGGMNPDGSLKPSPPLTRLFADDYYTEYTLLDPSTGQYRIGRRTEESPIGSSVFDWIRFEGELVPFFTEAEGGDLEFVDPRTGTPLKFIYGKPGDGYSIRVTLPRPVPQGGVGRIYIYKTFKDPRTYIVHGDDIVWVRSLVGARVGVVLPKGYGLVSSSVAAQIFTLEDGRLKLSFANPSGQVDPVTIHARKMNVDFKPVEFHEHVLDDIRTLYDLDSPESLSVHVDRRYTDYRKGPTAKLETLADLPVQELKVIDLDTAKEFTPMGTGASATIKLDVPIVDEKQSAHIKITGVLKDRGYRMEDRNLVFDRKLTGVRNTVILPAGWEVESVSQPGTIGMSRGRIFIAFINIDAESSYQVTIRARKRN